MRETDRWQARPRLGAALRLLALLVPLAVGVVAAIALASALPAAQGVWQRVLWWSAVLGGSVLATYATDRVARRVLPLAVLLELSLVFPDRAPSRLRAVRTASVRDLDSRLARLRGEGVPMEPYEAAETLVTLVGILGLHDKRTRGHSERVRALTDLLTDELGLDEDDRGRLRWAALVHDLGKLTVPVELLNGSSRPTPSEWEVLRSHPDEGVRLVHGLLPWLGPWGDAVGQHHERWDGAGYPRGLAGDEISYGARLVAVCDSFETMTSVRSYQPARSAAEGRRELARCAGTQFDPAVVRAFLGISLGRLTWVLGPVTWLAQVPFVAAADRAGQAVKAGAVAAAVGGLVGVGALPGPTAASAPLPTAAPVASAAATPPVVLPPALQPPAVVPPASVAGPTAVAPAADVPLAAPPVAPPAPDEPLAPPAAPAPATPAESPSTAPAPTAPTTAAPAPSTTPGNTPGPSADPTASPDPTPTGEPAPPTPSADPTPEPTPVASPVPSPPTSSSPSPEPVPTPVASPTPSSSSSPVPSPVASPSPVPVAQTLRYFLAADGLVTTAPAAGTATVPRGGTLLLDRPVDRTLTVTGDAVLRARLDFQERTGQARLTVRLLDCAPGGACTEVGTGQADQDKSTTSAGTPVPYEVVLAVPVPAVVEAGRVLRLELALNSNGAKADVLVALGGPDAEASRVELPATVLVADEAPVGPSVLLVVLVLLGLSALRPARPGPLAAPQGWRPSRTRRRSRLDPRR